MIQAVDVWLRRGRRMVLEGVSVNIEPGMVLAIAGANGAGKSTLLNVLAGDMRIEHGLVLADSLRMDTMRPLQRARIRSVLPQSSDLSFPFVVSQVVILGRYPHHAGKPTSTDIEAAEQAMLLADVHHLRDRVYTRLSGGERQRVQLARAIAQILGGASSQARYLLLDEPTASLDLAHQHSTLTVARQMAAAGCGVAVVLHDLNLVAQYADTMVLLHEGRIVDSGKPRNVLTPASIRLAFDVDAVLMEHPLLDCPVVVAHPLLYGVGGDHTTHEQAGTVSDSGPYVH